MHRIIHLGVDFGIGNLDSFWFPYICFAQDVCSDDHCGYRSLAVLLGKHEDKYVDIRRLLAAELIRDRDLYYPISKRLVEGTWEQLIMRVSYCVSPCTQEYWLHMSFIGLVFATLFQVGLVLLTWHAPTLCLPLRARTGNDQPPTTILLWHMLEYKTTLYRYVKSKKA